VGSYRGGDIGDWTTIGLDFRQLFEHRWPSRARKKRWKRDRDKHSEFTPAQQQFEPGNPPILSIGAHSL